MPWGKRGRFPAAILATPAPLLCAAALSAGALCATAGAAQAHSVTASTAGRCTARGQPGRDRRIPLPDHAARAGHALRNRSGRPDPAVLAGRRRLRLRRRPRPVWAGAAPIASVRPGPAPITSVRPGPAPITSVRPGPAPITSVRPGPAPITSVRPGPAPITSARPGPAPITSVRPGPAPITSVRPGPAPVTSLQPPTPPGTSRSRAQPLRRDRVHRLRDPRAADGRGRPSRAARYVGGGGRRAVRTPAAPGFRPVAPAVASATGHVVGPSDDGRPVRRARPDHHDAMCRCSGHPVRHAASLAAAHHTPRRR